MSLAHFYLDTQVIAEENAEVFPLRLLPDDARHARVLRLSAGEHIAIIDAAKDYFECEIVSFTDEIPLVRIAKKLDDGQEEGPVVALIQGLAKGEKMDAIIRHVTEIGISAFIPITCERSVVKLDEKKAKKRFERWCSIAKSAAMQSGRRDIPEVSPLMSVGEVCSLLSQLTCVLIFWEEATQIQKLSDIIQGALASTVTSARDAKIAVVIGPEGGLTRAEVNAFLASCARAQVASLGSSILRTETAGVVAPALVLYELGELGN